MTSEFAKWHNKKVTGINHCGGKGYCTRHKEGALWALKWAASHKEKINTSVDVIVADIIEQEIENIEKENQ